MLGTLQPNFGPPPSADDETLVYHSKLAQHGFARNQTWVSSISCEVDCALDVETQADIAIYLYVRL
jgi:D-hexose-6-phosphate mutarotase